MVYKKYEWGRSSFPVDADVVGKEVEKLAAKKGAVTAADVVEEARPKRSKLHPAVFQHGKEEAAELWWRQQARNMVNSLILVTQENPAAEKERAPAFYHVNYVTSEEEVVTGYQPVSMVLEDKDSERSAIEELLAQLEGLKRRGRYLEPLAPVWKALDRVTEKLTNGGS